MKTVSPWQWPETSREDLHRSELLRKADGVASLNLAGAEYRLRFPKAIQKPFQPTVETTVSVGGMRILIESESIPRVEPMLSLLAGLEDGDLPSEALGAVLESSLTTILDEAETTFGAPLVIERSYPIEGTPSTSGLPAIDILLEPVAASEGGSIRIRARLQDHELASLLERLVPAAAQVARDMGHIPLLMTFIAAESELRADEFADLGCGDVILIDADPRMKNGIKVRTGASSRACALASWDGRNLILEEKMAMEAEKVGAHGNTGRGFLQEIDIEMSFELGRRLITIGELGKLASGHVFMLPENPEGHVDIRVNGLIIGRGTLVKVSGHTGIRVESLRRAMPDLAEKELPEPAMPEPVGADGDDHGHP